MTLVDRGDLATKLDADNPWPGPEAFRREDSRFFFGRDRARDALTRLVLQNRLVLLYGRSGLGKTSLLRAGVFPRLEEALTLPIHIRLQFGAADETASATPLLQQIKSAIEDAVARAGADAPSLDSAATLWEWFYRTDAHFYNERSRRVRPVLVFDQFEEAFTHGRATPEVAAATDRFLDQLIDLIRGSVPAPVAERLEQDAARALDYVSDRDACGVLLAIRQEFLAELLRLRPRLPSLLDHRFELSGMTLEDAESVVTGAGGQLIEPGVEKVIVRFVAAARRNVEDLMADDTTVDPAILSIFCRELNTTRQRRRLPRITADLVAGVQTEIIADFYRRSVADLPASVRSFIEEQLVTPSGYRNSVAWDQAARDAAVAQAIDPLVDRRLIRVEGVPPRARIELTHDVLTDPIVQSRNLRRAQEVAARAREDEENARIAAQEEAQRQRERDELEAKRRAVRNRSFVVLVLLVLLAGVGVLAVKAYRSQHAAMTSLSFAHVEQGLGLVTAGRSDRGLAYVAQAIRDDPNNVTARSLALDAVLHANWALPEARFAHETSAWSPSFGARDATVVTISGGFAWRWDIATQRSTQKIEAPGRGAVMSVAIRRQDDRIAFGTFDGALRLPEREELVRAHTGPILRVEFDAKGERIVTASTDGTAALWNAHTGARLMHLVGHRDVVQTAQFSPDGKAVVTASRDGRAILWNVSGKLPIQRFQLNHTAAVVSARFDRAGTHIVTASEDGSVRIWSAMNGDPLGAPLKHDEPPVWADFSPEGLRIVTATATRVVVWSVEGYRLLEPIQFDASVTGASFSTDGRRLVTTTIDGTTTVWDVRGGAAAPINIRVPCGPNAVIKFTGTINQAVVGCPDSGRIDFWDVSTGQLSASESNPAWVGLRAFDFRTGSGRVLAVTEGTASISRIGAPEVVTLSHGSRILQATFSPDGKLVATAGDDGTAVWDAATGRAIVRVARGSQSWSVDFTADAARIATLSVNGSAEVWDAQSGNRISTANATPDNTNQADARINASGDRVVVASRFGVTLFNARSGEAIAKLPVVASLDRPRVVIASTGTIVTVGDRVQLWNADKGHLLATLRERSLPVDAQFSADGTRLMTTHESGLRFWDTGTGQPQSGLVGAGSGEFGSATMDGQRVVAVSRDGFVRAWDFPMGTLQDADSIATALELMVGYKCNEQGAGEPIDKWVDKLRAARAQTGLTRILAWAFADRDRRAIGPFTTVTKDEYIREQLTSGSLDALREAQRLFPWDPQVSDYGVIR